MTESGKPQSDEPQLAYASQAQRALLLSRPTRDSTPEDKSDFDDSFEDNSTWPATSPPSSPVQPPYDFSKSPLLFLEDGGVFFGFTLRKASGVGLGLEVSRTEDGRALLVEAVLPGGAIEAWNRQVAGGPMAKKALTHGDAIVCAAGHTDSDRMLLACLKQDLLEMYFLRGGSRSKEGLLLSSPAGPERAAPRRQQPGRIGHVQLLSNGSLGAWLPTPS